MENSSKVRSDIARDTGTRLTMLDLIEAVGEVTDSETELVGVVDHLVNSGRVQLIGNFRGARID